MSSNTTKADTAKLSDISFTNSKETNTARFLAALVLQVLVNMGAATSNKSSTQKDKRKK